MLPPLAFARLWLNEFSASGGDMLTPADVPAAFSRSRAPMTGGEPGYIFVGGLDLGLVRDFSAFVILAIPDGGMGGKIKLAHHKVWRPAGDGTQVEHRGNRKPHSRAGRRSIGSPPCAVGPVAGVNMLCQRLEQMTQHRRRKTEIYQPLRRAGQQASMRPGSFGPTAAMLREKFVRWPLSHLQTDRRFSFYPCEPLRRGFVEAAPWRKIIRHSDSDQPARRRRSRRLLFRVRQRLAHRA